MLCLQHYCSVVARAADDPTAAEPLLIAAGGTGCRARGSHTTLPEDTLMHERGCAIVTALQMTHSAPRHARIQSVELPAVSTSGHRAVCMVQLLLEGTEPVNLSTRTWQRVDVEAAESVLIKSRTNASRRRRMSHHPGGSTC
jgi:hypothetical protein